MMHPFCMASKASTNEEYKKVLQKRMNMYLLLGVLGILTIAALSLSRYIFKNPTDGHIHSYYAGIGAGLMTAGLLLWIKNKRIINNEDLLKEARIKNTDERIQEISATAMRMATVILLVATYSICLIGGLIFPEYMPILSKVLLVQVAIFLVGYFVAFQIYNRKM